MAKSILVSEETHRRLMVTKMEMGFKSMDDMLGRLVTEVTKARFLEASERFRAALKRKHLSRAKVAASSEAVRVELLRQWFENEKSHP